MVKLVPPYVRFNAKNARNLISAETPAQIEMGARTLTQTP